MKPDEAETRTAVNIGPPSVLDELSKKAGRAVDPQVDLDGDRTRLAAPGEPGGAAPAPAAAAPATPAPAKYEIVEEIGRGGIGRVVRARDRDLRRSVAMKMLLPRRGGGASGEPLSIEARFLEEAQITAQLSHPGIVPVHELGVAPDGSAYFTMAVVRGKTLADAFAASRTPDSEWTQARVLGALQRVCDTVGYAHERGVVHRDLKPANVMVGRFGEVYVMDWGLARVRGRPDGRDLRPGEAPATIIESDRPTDDGEALRTLDGTILGTPAYMSPEQAEGSQDEVGPRSDVYSIGAMLYEYLAGQPPYMKPGKRLPAYVLLGCIVTGPPAPLAELASSAPEELRRIAERAMSRDPSKRQSTAAEVGADIQRYLDGIERLRREAAAREAEAEQARARSEVVLSVVLDRLRGPVEEVGRVEAVRGIADVVAHYLESSGTDVLPPSSARLHAAVMRWLSDVEGRIGVSEHQLRWARRAAELATTVPESDRDFMRERIRIQVALAAALDRVGDLAGATAAAGDAARQAEILQLGGVDDDLHRLRFAAFDALRHILRTQLAADAIDEAKRAEAAIRAVQRPTWGDQLALVEFLIDVARAHAGAANDLIDAWLSEASSLIDRLERERPGTWQMIRLNGELKLVTGVRHGKRGSPPHAVRDHTVAVSLLLHVESMDPQNPSRLRSAAQALLRLAFSLRSLQRNDEAVEKFEESIRRWRSICTRDPGDRPSMHALLTAMGDCATTLLAAGKAERGASMFEEAIASAASARLAGEEARLRRQFERRAGRPAT